MKWQQCFEKYKYKSLISESNNENEKILMEMFFEEGENQNEKSAFIGRYCACDDAHAAGDGRVCGEPVHGFDKRRTEDCAGRNRRRFRKRSGDRPDGGC